MRWTPTSRKATTSRAKWWSLPVSCELNGDWWHAEFIPKDGKIVYREAGGDPEAIAIAAGQTLTYDFNAGTGVIK